MTESLCPLDCPDACSLEVQVDAGRVVSVDGTHRNPVTAGFICKKVRRLPEALYGPDRVLRPAVKRGGKFVDVSWDEALTTVAATLADTRDRFGGESILPLSYGGSNGVLSQDTTDARLFYRLGASNLARTACAAPSSRAHDGLYGRMPGVAFDDYVHSKLIVIWGCNPHATSIHLLPYIKQAQRQGARLIVVDPRRTPLATHADLHVAVRPGTDLVVALAVVRWLFVQGRADEAFLDQHATGVDELRQRAEPWTLERAAGVADVTVADLAAFAEQYAEAEPAVIRCGWGPERNRNGGSATAAILALPAVAGKLGRRGGGFTMSNSGAWSLDPARAAAAVRPATRTINMNRLGAALCEADPAVRALFVYNCNPLATLPNQERIRTGLQRPDLFTVVFDSFWTDTAKYADVVLPAATFVERDELARGYGAYVLHRSWAVATPAGESRSNHDVFLALCDRLQVSRPEDLRTEAELVEAMLDHHSGGERLAADLAAGVSTTPPSGTQPIQFGDTFPNTADRKIHLLPADLDTEAPAGLYGYQPDPGTAETPLALISPAIAEMVSSTFGQMLEAPARLQMNPRDAGELKLIDGDVVEVTNDFGRVECGLAVTRDVRPGVVMLPKGLWARHTVSGTTANALCPDTLADLGGGACFNDARVRVNRA